MDDACAAGVGAVVPRRALRDKQGKLIPIQDEAKLIRLAGLLIEHNGVMTRVAKDMGVDPATAKKWSATPFVQAELARIKRQAARAAQITPDALAEEAALVAFAPRGKVRDSDKLAGLRLLGDWQGLAKTKTELTGPGGGPIQTESVVRVYLPHNGREALPEPSKDG